MQLEEFEELVLDAVEALPVELLSHLDNVAIVVQQWPSAEQMAEHELESRDQLMGLYEGIPLTDRAGYNLVLPDKITIFQGPLEAMCSTSEEIAAEVQKTVAHEIAHHFGIDDDRLEEMGLG
ncbi:MAG: metallopeptidase family protein [Chloroflexota bacterium]|nr:metallopeptidase family protein [Chloroflexota bacterium]MDE2940883.1 metallopeptidase family protein [Chloroflexota bacterium]MDE3268416.1 metallopeptidase family protein [Chloroflexota bacterium]